MHEAQKTLNAVENYQSSSILYMHHVPMKASKKKSG